MHAEKTRLTQTKSLPVTLILTDQVTHEGDCAARQAFAAAATVAACEDAAASSVAAAVVVVVVAAAAVALLAFA